MLTVEAPWGEVVELSFRVPSRPGGDLRDASPKERLPHGIEFIDPDFVPGSRSNTSAPDAEDAPHTTSRSTVHKLDDASTPWTAGFPSIRYISVQEESRQEVSWNVIMVSQLHQLHRLTGHLFGDFDN
jgi:hypothetical protein